MEVSAADSQWIMRSLGKRIVEAYRSLSSARIATENVSVQHRLPDDVTVQAHANGPALPGSQDDSFFQKQRRHRRGYRRNCKIADQGECQGF